MFNDYQTMFYSQDTVRKSVLNSYLWMALGLIVTGAVSFGLIMDGRYRPTGTASPTSDFGLFSASAAAQS